MARWAFPVEERKAAVRVYNSGMGTLQEVCDAFQCHPSSLKRWLRSEREGRSLAPSAIRGHRQPLLGPADLVVLRGLVEQKSDATFDELTDRFNVGRTIRVSRSTVMRAVWSLGFTLKKRPSVRPNSTPRRTNAGASNSRNGLGTKTPSESSASTNPGATSP